MVNSNQAPGTGFWSCSDQSAFLPKLPGPICQWISIIPDSTEYQLPFDKSQSPLLFLKPNCPLTLALSHPGTRALHLNNGREVVPPKPPGPPWLCWASHTNVPLCGPLHTCSREPSLSAPTNRTGPTLLPALVQILTPVHMPSSLKNQRKACPSS